uniref:Uncharacterized protein n=1 Tax=Anopheles maculatus TaxID=74869 RepID=A0A182SVJ8_9DIPT
MTKQPTNTIDNHHTLPSQGCPVDLTRSMDNGTDAKQHAIRDTDKEAATKRLAFSVENILDPNKFNGKHSVTTSGVTPVTVGGILGGKLNGGGKMVAALGAAAVNSAGGNYPTNNNNCTVNNNNNNNNSINNNNAKFWSQTGLERDDKLDDDHSDSHSGKYHNKGWEGEGSVVF